MGVVYNYTLLLKIKLMLILSDIKIIITLLNYYQSENEYLKIGRQGVIIWPE